MWFGLGVASNVLSRRVEARADAFALELTRDPDAFIELERRLALRNVSDPDPPRLLHAAVRHPPDDPRADRRSARRGRNARLPRLVSRRALIERVVRELASYERPSASDGERRAAEWLAGEFRTAGCREVRVEEERAHGGYWWPLGLLNAGSALAALLGRLPAVLVGGLASAAVYDDVSGGRLWFRRRTLPQRPTWNVVAELGDPDAPRTVVFIAHHDAAHSGPRLPPCAAPDRDEAGAEAPRAGEPEHPDHLRHVPGAGQLALWGLLGRRWLKLNGLIYALGAACAMANIGASRVVPGANDNLSSVGVLVALANELSEDSPAGVRVILLSTGSEEGFMEGMQAFGRRHFGELDRRGTEFVCLECVGSPHLCVVEAEGMLRMRHYPEESREALARAGTEAGVELTRGLRTVAATDALIALRAGYPTCTLGGVDETKFPAEYHWPSDTPDNLDWSSVEDVRGDLPALRERLAPPRRRSSELGEVADPLAGAATWRSCPPWRRSARA